MQDVFFHECNAVAELAEFLPRRGGLHTEDRIDRLSGGQVVGPGAHATDTRGDSRHFLHGPADAELFKTPQLNHIHAGIAHIAFIVKLYGHLCMPLDAGYRLNNESPAHDGFFPFVGTGRSLPCAPAKRLNVAARSGISFVSSPTDARAPIISTMGFAVSARGPKQPRHGMYALMHLGVRPSPPQPEFVAGPRQRNPCSMRQRTVLIAAPGVNSTGCNGRLSAVPIFRSRTVGQSSQTLFPGSFRGVFCRSAVTASTKISGVGGQPGSFRSTGTNSWIAYTRSVSAGICSCGTPLDSVLTLPR